MRTKTLVAIIACLMLLCSCALAEDVTITALSLRRTRR